MQRRGSVVDGVADVQELAVGDLPTRPSHATIVLVEPSFFDLTYAINPYMAGEIDSDRAREQWERLRAAFERHADTVRVLDPAATWRELGGEVGAPPPEARPDMVFVANHALPTPRGDGFVLSRMATDERAGEPTYFRDWAQRQGYGVRAAPSARFEGTGDALWHPGRELLWGGYGIRTERAAYDELADRLGVTVVPLELTDDRHYHLDVSMAPLSESAALIHPEAFTPDGRAMIDAAFETVLEAPPTEATDALSVNVEVVDGTVIIGDDAPETTALLERHGYDVVTVDTGEFRKAGGSVYCLSLSTGTPS